MNNGLTENDIIAAAKDAVAFVRQNFQITLDYSDKSIEDVEKILGRFHNELPKGFLSKLFRPTPPPEKISQIVRMFGSYVGEALRPRLVGSRWEVDNTSGHSVISLTDGNKRVWPHAKVRKRIVNGPEDNILHYFTGVIEHWNSKA